jgi:PKD repeat protein
MKRILIPVFCLVSFFANAQQEGNIHRCLTDHNYEQYLKAHPEAVKNRDEAAKLADLSQKQGTLSKSGTVIIIPVVFHVFHTWGTENISKAQIEDQIRILNEDFRRTNPDQVNTRSQFVGVAADMEIEFRLAQKDPNGNCTDGIVRVYEPMTVNADNAIKAKSRWDSRKYLNIWVVSTIKDTDSDPNTTTLGYAQFPWDLSSSPSTDGFMIRSDYVGSIGTSNAARAGRTATHEIGHWIGLYHPFQGGCNPPNWGEKIADTPPVTSPSYGCNLNRNSCSNDNPNLPDQIENFMDYANGGCQNMFTIGQKNVASTMMNSYRSQIYSPTNLSLTGVDVGSTTLCPPIADFINTTAVNGCEGFTVSFKDYSFNGTATGWEWTFPGGSPATSNAQNPTVEYSTEGNYNVTLRAINSAGSNTKTRTMLIQVKPAIASIKAPLAEGMESGTFPPANWTRISTASPRWERSVTAKSTGSASMWMNNYYNTEYNKKDAMITPSFDLSVTDKPVAVFYIAYAQRATNINDALSVYVSTDCGVTWSSALFSKFGQTLASTTVNPNPFFPTDASQWKKHTIDLNAYRNSQNVQLKFESMSRSGNNLFIDDINIASAASVGMNDISDAEAAGLNVYPNPFAESAVITYTIPSGSEVTLGVYDVLGRELVNYVSGTQLQGTYNYTFVPPAGESASGLYFVRLRVNDAISTQKLLLAR